MFTVVVFYIENKLCKRKRNCAFCNTSCFKIDASVSSVKWSDCSLSVVSTLTVRKRPTWHFSAFMVLHLWHFAILEHVVWGIFFVHFGHLWNSSHFVMAVISDHDGFLWWFLGLDFFFVVCFNLGLQCCWKLLSSGPDVHYQTTHLVRVSFDYIIDVCFRQINQYCSSLVDDCGSCKIELVFTKFGQFCDICNLPMNGYFVPLVLALEDFQDRLQVFFCCSDFQILRRVFGRLWYRDICDVFNWIFSPFAVNMKSVSLIGVQFVWLWENSCHLCFE